MLTNGAFRFGNFLLDVSAIFMFVLWFWLLITVIGDLFRRQRHFGLRQSDMGDRVNPGPYFVILIYLISQSRGMAERDAQRMQQIREELRHFVGYSVADELKKLERLKNSGTTSNEEYNAAPR